MPEDPAVHNDHCENLKSYKMYIYTTQSYTA
jgi:hypothetical protein